MSIPTEDQYSAPHLCASARRLSAAAQSDQTKAEAAIERAAEKVVAELVAMVEQEATERAAAAEPVAAAQAEVEAALAHVVNQAAQDTRSVFVPLRAKPLLTTLRLRGFRGQIGMQRDAHYATMCSTQRDALFHHLISMQRGAQCKSVLTSHDCDDRCPA